MFNTGKLEWIAQLLKSESEAVVMHDSVSIKLYPNRKLTLLVG